jgi:hypothetical protein
VDPRVEAGRQLRRGDRSQPFSDLKNLTVPCAMSPA